MAVMREWCYKHNITRLAGVQCHRCATEAATADRLHAIVETLHIHSGRMDENFDLLMALEARIADLSQALFVAENTIDALARRLRAAEDRINRLSERSL